VHRLHERERFIVLARQARYGEGEAERRRATFEEFIERLFDAEETCVQLSALYSTDLWDSAEGSKPSPDAEAKGSGDVPREVGGVSRPAAVPPGAIAARPPAPGTRLRSAPATARAGSGRSGASG